MYWCDSTGIDRWWICRCRWAATFSLANSRWPWPSAKCTNTVACDRRKIFSMALALSVMRRRRRAMAACNPLLMGFFFFYYICVRDERLWFLCRTSFHEIFSLMSDEDRLAAAHHFARPLQSGRVELATAYFLRGQKNIDLVCCTIKTTSRTIQKKIHHKQRTLSQCERPIKTGFLKFKTRNERET